MKLLTDNQKNWLNRRQVKENGIYSFPEFGFHIYATPSFAIGEFIPTNPWTKSLAHHQFIVKEKIGVFCRGNFYSKPSERDFYMLEHELSRRVIIEIAFLYLTCFIPLVIYNTIKSISK